MGTMRIIDHTGDTIVDWRPDDPTSVDEAEAIFKRLRAERQMPFGRAAGAPASDAALLRAFDPTLEEIVWVRPVQGG